MKLLRLIYSLVTAIGAVATGIGVVVAIVIGALKQKVIPEPWLAMLAFGIFLLVSGVSMLVLQRRLPPPPSWMVPPQIAPVPVSQQPQGADANTLATAASRPREYVELDPSEVVSNWADLTTAQQDEVVKQAIGKWARVNGVVEDVWSDPPAIFFSVDSKRPKPYTITIGARLPAFAADHLNVLLVFDANTDRLLRLKAGDAFEVEGVVAGMDRNMFGVAQLIYRQCEWLK